MQVARPSTGLLLEHCNDVHSLHVSVALSYLLGCHGALIAFFRRHVRQREALYQRGSIDADTLIRSVASSLAACSTPTRWRRDGRSFRHRSTSVAKISRQAYPYQSQGCPPIRLEPGAAWRELEQRHQELPDGEPQQQRPRQPQRQHRLPPAEHTAGARAQGSRSLGACLTPCPGGTSCAGDRRTNSVYLRRVVGPVGTTPAAGRRSTLSAYWL